MPRYGLQLYSVRDVSANLPYVLGKVGAIGYKTVEFAGLFGYDPLVIKSSLDSLGLSAIGTHTPISALTEENIEKTAKTHLALGAKHLTVPSGNWSSEESFKRNIEILNSASSILKEYGIELGYHNHSTEFYRTPYGVTVEEKIIEETDINIELDTFWAYNAGVDPVRFMEKYRNRIKLIHLKDGFARPRVGADFTNANSGALGKSLGLGNAPVADVRAFALEKKIEIIVESEDLAPTGLIEAERCMKYLRSLE